MHAGNGQLHQIDKSRQLQRKLYLAAKKCRERRFHALYDRIFRPDVLWRAWQEVKANGGSAGVDGVSLEEVERQGVAPFLEVNSGGSEGRKVPTPAGAAGIHSQAGWPSAAPWDSDSARPDRPTGVSDSNRASLRSELPKPVVRVSTEAQCGASSPRSRQSAVARLVDSRRRHPRVF